MINQSQERQKGNDLGSTARYEGEHFVRTLNFDALQQGLVWFPEDFRTKVL